MRHATVRTSAAVIFEGRGGRCITPDEGSHLVVQTSNSGGGQKLLYCSRCQPLRYLPTRTSTSFMPRSSSVPGRLSMYPWGCTRCTVREMQLTIRPAHAEAHSAVMPACPCHYHRAPALVCSAMQGRWRLMLLYGTSRPPSPTIPALRATAVTSLFIVAMATRCHGAVQHSYHWQSDACMQKRISCASRGHFHYPVACTRLTRTPGTAVLDISA